MTVRIGVSGWSYDEWSGDFYPEDLPASRRLRYVAERFDTVEANGSFYSLLTPSAYRSWYDDTPAGFRMAVKGSRFITHNKSLSDARVPLANFFASGPLALKEKLGPILWQLPERHALDPERLDFFLSLLPGSFEEAGDLAGQHDDEVEDAWIETGENHRIRHVLEARHESFRRKEAVRILRDRDVAMAISHAGDWERTEEITAGFVYLRLHGAPRTYRSGYGDEALDDWARKIRKWAAGGEPEDALGSTDLQPPRRKGRDVYVYFDNDTEGRAPYDALALTERVG
ncbi:MAG: DUF72 domain-containing protein [Longimicrobiales bacterium]|nr:DUF72 domain-containing protein [Longimicrobiales bacterium]